MALPIFQKRVIPLTGDFRVVTTEGRVYAAAANTRDALLLALALYLRTGIAVQIVDDSDKVHAALDPHGQDA